MPTFSIIIPTYNAEGTILRCLNSIGRQEFRDFEVIIVNDCSTDGTLDLIESFSGFNLVVIKNVVNSGPSFSRNEGLKIAKGEFVAFLDSDDYWLPNHLLNVYLFSLKHVNIDFFYTGVIVRKNSYYFLRYSIREVDVRSLLKCTPICTSSVIIRRSATYGIFFKEVFYDDLLFWYEVLLRCGKAVRVDPKTAVYVVANGSYSANKFKSAKKVYDMYKRNFKLSYIERWFYYLSYIYFGILKVVMQKYWRVRV